MGGAGVHGAACAENMAMRVRCVYKILNEIIQFSGLCSSSAGSIRDYTRAICACEHARARTKDVRGGRALGGG